MYSKGKRISCTLNSFSVGPVVDGGNSFLDID